jgi:hypothetical protein
MSASSKRSTRTNRRAHWRDTIARQAASGLSVAAFCRGEAIATPTFYLWRKRLAADNVATAQAQAKATPSFISLGPMNAAAPANSGIDIRLDLPGGITLTITRR